MHFLVTVVSHAILTKLIEMPSGEMDKCRAKKHTEVGGLVGATW